MKNSLILFFDFFLPRFCPGCKNKLNSSEKVICPLCINKIKIAEEDRLIREYKRKFSGKGIISGFSSLYVFEKDKELQHLIHSLKYEKRFLTGVYLGRLIGCKLKSIFNDWKIELIIPVPLHHVKKSERGFNQSFFIAKGLSKEISLPVYNKVIKRKIYTESQTTMTLKEREENIGGAFAVKRGKKIPGKNILLLDDVITTGATVSECGKVLLNKGAKKVYAASVAIAD